MYKAASQASLELVRLLCAPFSSFSFFLFFFFVAHFLPHNNSLNRPLLGRGQTFMSRMSVLHNMTGQIAVLNFYEKKEYVLNVITHKVKLLG